MPGYEQARIVGISEDDLQEFICGICLNVFIKPTVTECCGHIYCYDCISESLSGDNTCPNDKEFLDHAGLKSPPKMVINMLGNLKIECDYKDNGCEAIVKIKELDKHLANDCLYNKCEKCGLTNKIHTDQMCNQVLFEELKVLRKRIETLEIENETLAKNQVKIYTDKYSFENLIKVKNMGNSLEVDTSDTVLQTEQVCEQEGSDEENNETLESISKNKPVISPRTNNKQLPPPPPPPPPPSSSSTKQKDSESKISEQRIIVLRPAPPPPSAKVKKFSALVRRTQQRLPFSNHTGAKHESNLMSLAHLSKSLNSLDTPNDGKVNKRLPRLTKEDIGVPYNFQHIQHIGFDDKYE